MPALRRFSSTARPSTSAAALAATVFCGGLAWAPAANAEQVLLEDVAWPGSPDILNTVDLMNGEVLTLDPGASIITADDALVDAANGSAITLKNDGTIISTVADSGIDTNSITDLPNSGIISDGHNGIYAYGDITNLINSGIIQGATGTYHSGIDMDFGKAVNSVRIESETGIEVDRTVTDDDSNSNTGTIRSLEGPSGTAIEFQGSGPDALPLLRGPIIEGKILLDGAHNTVNFSPVGHRSTGRSRWA